MIEAAATGEERSFTPALGHHALTPFYDMAIRLLTSERIWRTILVEQIALAAGDRLIDVGCGTGSLLAALHKSCLEAELFGIEPDPRVLAVSKARFPETEASVLWHNGFIHNLKLPAGWVPNKIVSSLVFHQVPLAEKATLLDAILELLAPGGEFFLADYMTQESALMRGLFRVTVQCLDGLKDTRPNAEGVLEVLLCERFPDTVRVRQIHTPTGTISIWRATKPDVSLPLLLAAT
jgi:ubiquinone/menaquinone biosynthesis C-methylase UbiE